MPELKVGVLLWNQATDWPSYLAAAQRLDRLGYDHIWAWDHLYAIFGDPHQPIFEGWASLAALGTATQRARLGLLVGAVPFRNPGLVAKLATTLDHISGGRAILGMGGAWHAGEATAHGIEFGSGVGERLDWLDEAIAACRALFDGETVTSAAAAHYRFADLQHLPPPIQRHLPIMIGGAGERKTLRTVAQHADLWNAMGSVEKLAHKVDVLRQHCADVGRDPAEIEFTLGVKLTIRDSTAEAERVWKAAIEANRTPFERVAKDDSFWNGSPEELAERLGPYLELGFRTVISEQPAPYDTETLDRFIGQLKPLAERG